MSDFTASIEAFANRALLACDEVKLTVAVDLGTAVINDTPVSDEETAPGKPHGFLKANWQASLNTPAEGTIPLRDGLAAVAELESVAAQATGDDVIIERNNTVYGPRIEYEGWSHTKAPEGMVRKNVAQFQQAVNEAVMKVAA